MTSSRLHKGVAQIHVAVFLFGFAGLFGKFLSCDPLYIVLGRTVFAAAALFVHARFVSRTVLFGFEPKAAFFFLLQGILLALHWWCFFVSIQVSSVAVGLVTFSTFPLFVTFLEPLWFRENLQRIDILTAGAVFAGILLVVPEYDLGNQVTKGAIFGILSGLTFALLALVNRKNARVADAIAVAFYQNLFAAACLVLPIFFVTFSGSGIVRPALSDLPLLVLLGVVCTALAHTLFIRSLSAIRAQTASVIAGLEPVYGIVLAFFLLREIPAARTLAGGIVIVGTTLFASLRTRDKKA